MTKSAGLPTMNRIAVIGCSGSGKSTLSRELGRALGLPVVHLDCLFWKPGWVESPREEFAELVRGVVTGERWVLDGTYRFTWNIVMPRVDTIVFLDFSRTICLWRVLARYLAHRGRTRQDVTAGCPEKIDFEFVEFIWTFPTDYRPSIISRLDQRRPDQRLIVLRDPADVMWFRREMGIV
jgi:adenylate kinase family enzyme